MNIGNCKEVGTVWASQFPQVDAQLSSSKSAPITTHGVGHDPRRHKLVSGAWEVVHHVGEGRRDAVIVFSRDKNIGIGFFY